MWAGFQTTAAMSIVSGRCGAAAAVVGADLDPSDGRAPRPRATGERHRAGPDDPGPGHEVGHPRREDQRPRGDLGDRLADLVRSLAVPVGDRVLEAGERPVA